MQKLQLKPREDRRLRQGHLWVFSNEVARFPEGAEAGDLVEVVSHAGASLGTAAFHPHSLITARLLGPGVEELGTSFFVERLSSAARLRERLLPDELCYRLAHGESDRLPGLIVDRFGDCMVVQTLSCAMDRAKGAIVEALQELFRPQAVLERNDVETRRLEGLPLRRGVLSGTYEPPSVIVESGIQYRLDLLEGQKTGFFLDQKWNRRAAAAYCAGLDVLDCFCNQGGFGLAAAKAAARSVIGVDASGPALQAARDNARINDLDIDFVESEVFRFLEEAVAAGRELDVVILDPPSFAPRKKDAGKARKAYQRLNELAMRVLRPEGFLVTSSCSHHLREEVFFEVIRHAAVRAGKRLQQLERRGQGPDHPVHPSMPESAYLKCGIFRVL